MSTRFYFCNAAATFTPTVVNGAWTGNSFSTQTRLASTTRTGTAATYSHTRPNTTAVYAGGVGRWVSEPLVNSGTIYTGYSISVGTAESNALADMVLKFNCYVLAGSTNTVRGTFLEANGSTEWATTGASRSVGGTGAAVDVQVGDRIVWELGHLNLAVLATAGAYIGTINYGGTGTTDLPASNGDTAVTTKPGWWDFSAGNTNDFGVFAPYTLQQTGFRFRFDDGSETTATWRAATNTNVNLVASEIFRLRFLIRDNAGSFPATALKIQYRRNGGTWTDVSTSDTYIQPNINSQLISDTTVTEQLAGPGTFVTNTCTDRLDGIIGAPALTVGQEIEAEFSLTTTANVVNGDTYDFRVADSAHAIAIQGYTQTPTATIGTIAKSGTDAGSFADTRPLPVQGVLTPLSDALTHTDTSFLTIQKTDSDVQALTGEVISARAFNFFETHKLAERTPDFVRVEAGGIVDLEFRITAIAGAVQNPPLILPDYITATVSPIRNSPGSFQFEYPADGLNYSSLRSLVDNDVDAEVEIWIDGSSKTALRGLILESDGDDIAEVGTRTFSGCFLEWRLSEYKLGFSADILSEHGEWFFGAPPGSIVGTVMAAAQADGFLTDITYDTFGATLDSNGVQWANTGTLTVAPGTSLLDLFSSLVEIGMMEFEIDGLKRLKVYNPGGRGLDRTLFDPPLELKAGKHINASPRKHSVRESATDILVSGKDGIYGETFNAAARSRRGRQIMTYQSQGSIEDPGALDQYAVQRLGQLTTGTTEVTHGLTFGPTDPTPIINYTIGDWVYSDARPGKPREKLRIVQWAIQQDANARPTGTITLNDWIDETNVKLTQQLTALQNGSTVVGTSVTDFSTDTLAPAKVTGVGASSNAYHTIRADGSIEDGAVGLRALLNVFWTPTALNTDGTALKDLSGYLVRYRYTDLISSYPNYYISAPQLYGGTGGVVADVDPGRRVRVSVAARDLTGNIGVYSDEFELITAVDDVAPPQPSRPSVFNHLGILDVHWDGLGSLGQVMPTDFSRVEVHMSTSAVFTPDTTTYINYMRGQSSVTWQGSTGVTYYFRFIAIDAYGNRSTASETASGISQMAVDNLSAFITAANLASNSVTTPAIAPESVTTTSLSVAAFSPNQIFNGGFEDGQPSDPTSPIPARWTVGGFASTTGTAGRVVDILQSKSGEAFYKVTLASVQGFHDLTSDWMPVAPGEMWYIEMYGRASRAAGDITVYAQYSSDGSTPLSSTLYSTGPPNTMTTEYQLYTDQYSVALFETGIAPSFMRFIVRFGASSNGADVSPATFWLDDVRTRKVVGRAEIANAAIGNAQIDNLAVQNANVANLNVGKLVSGTGTFSMLMASGGIRSGDTGQRWILDISGLRFYDSTGTIIMNAAPSGVSVIGDLQTGKTGSRVQISGVNNDIRFYPQAGETRLARIFSYIPVNAPSDIALEMRSIDSDTGGAYETYARLFLLPQQGVMTISPNGTGGDLINKGGAFYTTDAHAHLFYGDPNTEGPPWTVDMNLTTSEVFLDFSGTNINKYQIDGTQTGYWAMSDTFIDTEVQVAGLRAGGFQWLRGGSSPSTYWGQHIDSVVDNYINMTNTQSIWSVGAPTQAASIQMTSTGDITINGRATASWNANLMFYVQVTLGATNTAAITWTYPSTSTNNRAVWGDASGSGTTAASTWVDSSSTAAATVRRATTGLAVTFFLLSVATNDT